MELLSQWTEVLQIKFLVVGGNGNLGKGCVKKLNSLRIPTLVWDEEEDLFKLSKNIIKSQNIQAILNFSVLANKSKFVSVDSKEFRVNVLGVQKLLDLSEESEIPLIQLSTREVIGFQNFTKHKLLSNSIREVNEQEPMLPENSYGMTKLIGEFLLASKPNVSIVRLNTCYTDDWRSGKGLIASLIKKSREEGTVMLDNNGQAIRDPLHINDLVELIIIILKKKAFSNIFHAGGGYFNRYSLANICRLANPQVRINSGKSNLDKGFLMDISKAQALGWAPKISFSDWIDENKT